ncbi:hypothetical protein RD110_08690 [Rhodoferax koreense]|uniref:Phasin domain-containing protein n=2 Tax=Rhodoferax koreensis TaxID=1842727 RepID=A0A1P8JU33_9BURK|nr:hypothetical protein RD110_08690 [Rhodoferax koreense]
MQQLWLHGLEVSRRAQARMARTFAEDMSEAARKLAASKEPKDWLNVQAEFLGKSIVNALAAQGDALAAWGDLQAACTKHLVHAGPIPKGEASKRLNGEATASSGQDAWASAWQQMGNAWAAALAPAKAAATPSSPLAADAWLETVRANAQKMTTAWVEATRAAAQAG